MKRVPGATVLLNGCKVIEGAPEALTMTVPAVMRVGVEPLRAFETSTE